MSTSHYHVFSIPLDLLETLTNRNLVDLEQARDPLPDPVVENTAPTVNGSRACNICHGSTFVGVDEQRTHFRSDWHRYNVKLRLGGGRPVTESDFALLVDGGFTFTSYLSFLIVVQHLRIRYLARHHLQMRPVHRTRIPL
jgi:hypothetical protein